MDIVWINDHADFTGGCEQYIFQTVSLLKQQGVHSTLLYQVNAPISPAFTAVFDQAFPMVDITMQLKEIAPHVIYIHGLADIANLRKIASHSCPKIRFFHDQKLFCLREHKYTTLGHKTCTKTLGMHCYSCLGFINRTNSFIGFKFNTLKKQRKELLINRQFDQFVVGSAYMANQLEAHGFSEQRITIASLFSKTKQTLNDNKIIHLENLPQAAEIKENQLLFVGQLVRGKGLDTLIKAIWQVQSRVQLLICGTGSMMDQYKKLVEKLNLNSQITFLGQQSQAQLSRHYQQSSAVVIPARAPETFCMVGLEALQHGTPVIATNVGGMSEWFKPGINGLVFNSNDDKQLTKQIDKYLSKKQIRAALRKNISLDKLKQFKPKHHLTIIQSLFVKVLEAS